MKIIHWRNRLPRRLLCLDRILQVNLNISFGFKGKRFNRMSSSLREEKKLPEVLLDLNHCQRKFNGVNPRQQSTTSLKTILLELITSTSLPLSERLFTARVYRESRITTDAVFLLRKWSSRTACCKLSLLYFIDFHKFAFDSKVNWRWKQERS